MHHKYKEENILLLKEYGLKVSKVYKNKFPKLIEVNQLIQDVTEEILEHIKNEETIIFPYIKELIELEKRKIHKNISTSPLDNSIKGIEDEHSKIGLAFKRISELTNNYTIPENVCASFKLLYIKLQNFDEELQEHIHIENNILFPRAKKLERKIRLQEEIA
ncbi:MAG: hemerythrin domain-containing protein [Polaribacter sp.]